MIELRGGRVLLTGGRHLRSWIVYQGGDSFEVREDDSDRWLLSQSSEWDYHDPSHGRRPWRDLQTAAESFTRSVTRCDDPRRGAPSERTRGGGQRDQRESQPTAR